MTLSISIARIDPVTGELDARVLEGGEGLFGVEATRAELWGSDAVRSLGARMLPSLRHEDLYVAFEELDELRAECERVRAAAREIANVTGYAQEYVTFRLDNLIAALEVARSERAGILVD